MGSAPRIKFGTDGWRGVIAEDFTFERVRLVAAALADTLRGPATASKVVFVGFDRRFLSPEFARAVAETLAGAGFEVRLSKGFCPTPAVSLALQEAKGAAGVVLTASHNPARWNGFKVKEPFGGSALASTTATLEAAIAKRLESRERLPRMPFDEARRKERIVEVDLGGAYRTRLRKLVDLGTIARAGWRLFVDPIHGAGSGFLAGLLREAGAGVVEIRADENPCFGGVNPEPIEENLGALRAALAEAGVDGAPRIGLALDGDADRIGAVDERGAFFDSHRIFATVLRHLLDVRRMPGAVAQTVSSTVMVRRLAAARGVDRIETPIGFKWIAEKMLAASPPVLMGGEESGGLGFSFHLPERDGALSGLMLLEACAHAGLPPRALLQQVFEETGEWRYARVDVHLDPGRSAETVAMVKRAQPASIAGAKVASRNDRDGVKFMFADDSWLLLRPSGTEPVLRVYAEAPTMERVHELIAAGRELAGA